MPMIHAPMRMAASVGVDWAAGMDVPTASCMVSVTLGGSGDRRAGGALSGVMTGLCAVNWGMKVMALVGAGLTAAASGCRDVRRNTLKAERSVTGQQSRKPTTLHRR